MLKFPLTSYAFHATADNGSGAAAQAGVSPAPATETAPTAPAKSLTTLEAAALFKQQREAPAKATAKPDTAPAAPAPSTPATGSDAGSVGDEDGAAAPAEPATPTGDEPGAEENVTPPEDVTPERKQQIQAGIDKLKAREAAAKAKADRLEAELEALKAAAAQPAEPSPTEAPQAPALPPPEGNRLFAAKSEQELVVMAEQMKRSVANGQQLLERMRAEGDDEITVQTHDGEVKMTRDAVLKDMHTLNLQLAAQDRAMLTLRQRQDGLAKAAKLHPEYFAHGQPKPAVQAVLREIPELAHRPDGVGIAAELAAARAARAKATPGKPAAPVASPTPAKPAAAPVPAVAASPAVLASRPSTLGTDGAPRSLSVMDMARRHSLARQAS